MRPTFETRTNLDSPAPTVPRWTVPSAERTLPDFDTPCICAFSHGTIPILHFKSFHTSSCAPPSSSSELSTTTLSRLHPLYFKLYAITPSRGSFRTTRHKCFVAVRRLTHARAIACSIVWNWPLIRYPRRSRTKRGVIASPQTRSRHWIIIPSTPQHSRLIHKVHRIPPQFLVGTSRISSSPKCNASILRLPKRQ